MRETRSYTWMSSHNCIVQYILYIVTVHLCNIQYTIIVYCRYSVQYSYNAHLHAGVLGDQSHFLFVAVYRSIY